MSTDDPERDDQEREKLNALFPTGDRGAEGVDWYETDSGNVVLFDEQNPDAWVESDYAIPLPRGSE